MVSGDFPQKSQHVNPDVNNFTMNPSRNQADRFYSHNIQNMSVQFRNEQNYLIQAPAQHRSPITPRDQFYGGLGQLKETNDDAIPQAQMLVTPPPVKTPGSQHVLNTEKQQLERQQLRDQHSLYHSQVEYQESMQSVGCSPPQVQNS